MRPAARSLVAVVLLTACGTTPAAREPRVLPVRAAGAERDTAAAGRDIAVPAYAKGGEVTVPDALLAGLPAEAPAYGFAGGGPDARALAAAFGIDAEPVADPDGGVVVRAGDSGPELRAGGGHWTYNAVTFRGSDSSGAGSSGSVGAVGVATAEPATVPPPPVPKEPKPGPPSSGAPADPVPPDQPVGAPVPCVSPPPGVKDPCGVPPSPPPMPSAETVRTAAAPVLRALGLTAEPARVEDGWGARALVVSPLVGGLPTSGYETRIDVGNDGRIRSATGFLGGAARGDTYPLLGVREAVASGGYGRPEPAIACLAPCPSPAPRVVTAVRLGLLYAPGQHESFLVPAWLLSFAGSTYEEPVLALPGRYLDPGQREGAAPAGTAPSE